MHEFELIDWIKRAAGKVPPGWLGIGDDAAVIPSSAAKSWVVATDAIVEGVDFDGKVTPAQAGRKALAINLSDMAAMGAVPKAFLMTLGIPPSWRSDKKIKSFLRGLFQLARKYRVICIGGDMTSARQFFCNVAVWGEPAGKKAILRSGARAGDMILVTGQLGGSITRKHYAFTPRVKEAEWLARLNYPSALMDVSDGLAQDLGHLTRASCMRARLNLECIPKAAAAQSLNHALTDGEDFELLMTVPQSRVADLMRRWKIKFPQTKLSLIGMMRSGAPAIDYFLNGKKKPRFSVKTGFQHF